MIKEVVNPLNNKKMTVVSGVISAIYMNELKEKKDYGKDGKSWIPTHSVNIVVDGTKVGLGLTDKEVLRVKDADETYHDLVRGLEITLPVNVGDYNGKPQYNGFSSGITVIGTDGVDKAQTQSGGFKQPYTAPKRDFSGIHTGHAINVAMNVLGTIESPENIIRVAKEAHDLTNKLKEEYGKANPDMSDYDLGASVGQAVLSASHFVESVDDIEAFARQTLDVIVPAVSAYVKGESSSQESKPVVKKPLAKKVTSKKEATPEPVDDSNIPSDAFDDPDSIPF